MKAQDIMTTELVTLSEEMTLEEAAKILLAHDISGAPVVNDEGVLVGILSEGDLVRTQKPLTQPLVLTFLDGAIPLNYKAVHEDLQALTATKVARLMTRDVHTLGPEAEAKDLARVMIEKDINRIPIVDSGRLLGIVSRQDLVRAQVERQASEDGSAL